MAFFQNSVLQKHLKTQDLSLVEDAYNTFKAYFHDPQRQQNIRDSKEEQFQEGFLREMFVKILGYKLNPEPEFNLTTELKNEKGGKKVDGAILKDGSALGVIELKGTDTKDLDKVNEQAFNYKNNHSECVYVITSNFEKLRFFIHNAVEHLEFNLFTLSFEEFQLLWLCLHSDNLISGLPQKVKEESLLAEENITKQLYKDYASFKTDLWQNMVKNHPKDDQLMLFKKTQKLLDRFLFIFFAEDSGLLPPNSISRIIDRWTILKREDAYKPLYDIFKQYFGYIDKGRKGESAQDDIFAYNGGLFNDDLILDNIKVDDDILQPYVSKLTAYDFQSEVDVNILGHIFENSLNEIENITAQLEGQEIDKSKTKRKKDGVFYTPKYITKYIVDNTIGKLCEEKKAELNITDERFGEAGKRSKKGIADLQAYRDWLLDLKICDPACGSGAFLNQALEFLINEHRYLDELTAQYHKAPIILSDIETQILEHNIYGVDINEESVEIAKLSLWLRTAQRGRKLTSLNNNIKCGNSLIDDPNVAGEKAFNWKKEFPEVFNKGGFDVVIGNPPYVRQELFSSIKEYLKSKFKVYSGSADLYAYFIEHSIKVLLSNKGLYSIIVANKWLRSNYGKPLRIWLKNQNITEIIDFGDLPVFENVAAYPLIITLKKDDIEKKEFWAIEVNHLNFSDLKIEVNKNRFKVEKDLLDDKGWALIEKTRAKLLDKLKNLGTSLKSILSDDIYYGVKTGYNEAFVIDGQKKAELISRDYRSQEIIKPLVTGKDISRYSVDFQDKYLIFSRRGIDIDKYPAIKEYLSEFYEDLKPREKSSDGKKGRAPGNYNWYEVQSSVAYYLLFDKPKIIYPDISIKGKFYLDSASNYYLTNTAYFLPIDSLDILGFLNSRLFDFYFRNVSPPIRGGYYRFFTQYMELVPISENIFESGIESKVSEQIEYHKSMVDLRKNFITLTENKLELKESSKTLKNWHELEFKNFLALLKKDKIKLSLSEEAEWMQYFNEQKQKAQELKSEINRVDAEIDKMVYELYGLTEEEIKVVEEN